MTITHIVMFDFNGSATPEKIEEISQAFLSLKTTCVNPNTKQPYVLSLTGGANTSTEGVRAPYSHGFLVTFASRADLEYYLKEDPAHLAFAETVGSLVEKNGKKEEGKIIRIVGVVDWET